MTPSSFFTIPYKYIDQAVDNIEDGETEFYITFKWKTTQNSRAKQKLFLKFSGDSSNAKDFSKWTFYSDELSQNVPLTTITFEFQYVNFFTDVQTCVLLAKFGLYPFAMKLPMKVGTA